MDLKGILFFRTKTELDAYLDMEEGYTEGEKEQQRQRFVSLYQVIEEAELEDEYQAWKEKH